MVAVYQMKICIICARGGSKRLTRKNLALFKGVPLVCHATELCVSYGFDAVIVSTDDSEIAQKAKECGAEIHQRSSALAEDDVPKAYAVRDALLWFEDKVGAQASIILSVQANSPTLDIATIREVDQKISSGEFGEVTTLFSDLRQNPAVRAFLRRNLFQDFYSTNAASVIFDGEDIHTEADLRACELALQKQEGE